MLWEAVKLADGLRSFDRVARGDRELQVFCRRSAGGYANPVCLVPTMFLSANEAIQVTMAHFIAHIEPDSTSQLSPVPNLEQTLKGMLQLDWIENIVKPRNEIQ